MDSISISKLPGQSKQKYGAIYITLSKASITNLHFFRIVLSRYSFYLLYGIGFAFINGFSSNVYSIYSSHSGAFCPVYSSFDIFKILNLYQFLNVSIF